jgi:hypothetical protein
MAGALARSGWSEEEAIDFNFAIYRILWGHAANRAACKSEVKGTFDKFRANKKIVGIPRLKELIDQRVINEALAWLSIRQDSSEAGSASAAPDEWSEPIPLLAKPPEPISPDVLPGVLGEYAQALSKHAETPSELASLACDGRSFRGAKRQA